MRRILVVLAVVFLCLPALAEAQTRPRIWKTPAECRTAFELTNPIEAEYWKPTIKRTYTPRAGERLAPIPYDMCALMTLPSDEGGQGAVLLRAGSLGWWRDGKLFKYAECANDIKEYVGLPARREAFTSAPAPAPQPAPAPVEQRVITENRIKIDPDTIKVVVEQAKPFEFEKPQSKRGWFDRNWKWFVPVAIAAAGGATYAATQAGQMKQEVNVYLLP